MSSFILGGSALNYIFHVQFYYLSTYDIAKNFIIMNIMKIYIYFNCTFVLYFCW